MLKDSRDNFNPSCDIANSYFLAKVLPIVRDVWGLDYAA
jgi:hypothetical protein